MKTGTIKLCGALFALAVTGTACVDEGENTSAPAGDHVQETLGIARFTTSESVADTTIIGFDDADHEVARVTLVHGGFTLTAPFTDDYPGLTNVIGRKLDISIRNESRLRWETADFGDTTRMPLDGHQPEVWALLADKTVKDALLAWKVGFDLSDDGETSYSGLVWSDAPDFQTECAGSTTCGPDVRGLTVNTCGGGGAPTYARRFNGNSNGVDEVLQCCPSGTGGLGYDWTARKLCPNSGTSTACGTASGACKGCAVYAQGASCRVWVNSLPAMHNGFICFDGNPIGSYGPSGSNCCSGLSDGWSCCGPAEIYTSDCSAWQYFDYNTYEYVTDSCARAAGC